MHGTSEKRWRPIFPTYQSVIDGDYAGGVRDSPGIGFRGRTVNLLFGLVFRSINTKIGVRVGVHWHVHARVVIRIDGGQEGLCLVCGESVSARVGAEECGHWLGP